MAVVLRVVVPPPDRALPALAPRMRDRRQLDAGREGCSAALDLRHQRSERVEAGLVGLHVRARPCRTWRQARGSRRRPSRPGPPSRRWRRGSGRSRPGRERGRRRRRRPPRPAARRCRRASARRPQRRLRPASRPRAGVVRMASLRATVGRVVSRTWVRDAGRGAAVAPGRARTPTPMVGRARSVIVLLLVLWSRRGPGVRRPRRCGSPRTG